MEIDFKEHYSNFTFVSKKDSSFRYEGLTLPEAENRGVTSEHFFVIEDSGLFITATEAAEVFDYLFPEYVKVDLRLGRSGGLEWKLTERGKA